MDLVHCMTSSGRLTIRLAANTYGVCVCVCARARLKMYVPVCVCARTDKKPCMCPEKQGNKKKMKF